MGLRLGPAPPPTNSYSYLIPAIAFGKGTKTHAHHTMFSSGFDLVEALGIHIHMFVPDPVSG